MSEQGGCVIVIDDDAAMREALEHLLQSVGIRVTTHASVAEFSACPLPDGPCCLVLDVRLPGQSGLEFQQQLARRGMHIPIIFVTGHADVRMSVRAMKAGAVEFLEKPFRDQDLLDAVEVALSRDRLRRAEVQALKALEARLETLTVRERQIMPLVAAGKLNKQIAAELGVTEITVKVHRGQMMRKMGARTLADLVRMADKLNLSSDG